MKVLVLAPSGFGKTISACGCREPELGIDILGLSPENTYFISETSKPLPRRGSARMFPVVNATLSDLSQIPYGRRVITSDAYVAAKVVDYLAGVAAIDNIVIDDTNYYMQDYMMEKSLATGWDAPKKAGHFMSKLFAAVEKAGKAGKTVFMLAHYTENKKNNKGEITFKMKTTGKTTDDMITPEGKFDVMLFGYSQWNDSTKKLEKFYVTNEDETFPAKSAPGMLPLYIPNDLGFVKRCIKAYYDGEELPSVDNLPSYIPNRPVQAVVAEGAAFGSGALAPPSTTAPAPTVEQPSVPVVEQVVEEQVTEEVVNEAVEDVDNFYPTTPQPNVEEVAGMQIVDDTVEEAVEVPVSIHTPSQQPFGTVVPPVQQGSSPFG